MTGSVRDLIDFSEGDDYPLMIKDENCPYNNETFNLWGYDSVENVGLNVHIVAGGGDLSHFNATVVIFAGENLYAGEFRGEARQDGAVFDMLSAINVEPMKRWTYNFDGPLGRTNPIASRKTAFADMPAERCSFELDVSMISPPIEQGTQGDDGVHVSSGTIARDARRYEQLARIAGRMTIGDRSIELDASGMRVHRRNSAGIYDSGVVGHVWITGIFPSGKGFHVCAYQNEPDARVGFCHAFYFDGVHHIPATVVEMPYFSGLATPETYDLRLEVEGETIEIEGLPNPPYLRGFASPIMRNILFSRAPGHFRLGGEIGGGVLERSLRSDFQAGGSYRATTRIAAE